MRSAAAIVIIALGACGSAFAGAVQIYGGQFNLRIPAEPNSGKDWMDSAVVEVEDHHIIEDVDVRINFTHEALFDLQILVQSPAGTNVLLNPAGNLAFIVRGEDGRLTAVGGSGQWLFDDEAGVSIEEATEPFFGSFRPVWALSLFDGQDSFGLWSLSIYDAFYADVGVLDGFELMITNPEPATAILLAFGAALMTIYRKAPGC